MAGFAQHIVDKDKGTSYEQPNLINPVPSKNDCHDLLFSLKLRFKVSPRIFLREIALHSEIVYTNPFRRTAHPPVKQQKRIWLELPFTSHFLSTRKFHIQQSTTGNKIC
ncbi:hypothetical protein P5673_003464 [Acropora cervicornis]|uniref:Uncharacterized protein n=1 Tax=Acropora cervicornis TaxID=6130 RepID=A0AAD9R392_ACRCE|nr:hypothetical protein P5673_003464 [Acropora cervicornis]